MHTEVSSFACQHAVSVARHAGRLLPAAHSLERVPACHTSPIAVFQVESVSLMMQLIPNGLPVLLTLTEAEADNFAIFLREILQSINGWWVSLQTFLFVHHIAMP